MEKNNIPELDVFPERVVEISALAYAEIMEGLLAKERWHDPRKPYRHVYLFAPTSTSSGTWIFFKPRKVTDKERQFCANA